MDRSNAQSPPLLGLLPGRRTSSNLVLALFLLPGARRRDALLFSDFCRTVDEIADAPGRTLNEKQDLLGTWLGALQPGHENALPERLRQMILLRNLDRNTLSEIVRGVMMDTEQSRYATFEELRVYCQRVASAVGITSARIFGASGPAVKNYAEQLGIALQLTNILRDIAEDAAMGRIYLPFEDLVRFGVSEREVMGGIPSPAMTHLLNHQAERADSFFAKAELAWAEMSVNQRRLMRPARLMSAIYLDLLLQMHRDRCDVFGKHYRVSGLKRVSLLIWVVTSGN